MGKKAISTTEAPQAIGPYSQAIQAGQFLFLSGQIALDPKTGTVVSGDVVEQTHRVMKNLKAVLAASGASLENIVKTTIYLKNLNDFVRVNEVYGTYFEKEPPARATVEVSNLPKGVDVEIEAIAYLGN